MNLAKILKLGGSIMKKRFYADLYAWDGTKTTQDIDEKNIDDIIYAVKGQYYMAGNGIIINGSNYCHVDIYYIEQN